MKRYIFVIGKLFEIRSHVFPAFVADFASESIDSIFCIKQ